MKKILYSLLAVLAVTFALVSCGDDDNSGSKHATPPEETFAGTYEGTWTKYDSNGTTVLAEGQEGTFTIDEGDVDYSAKLTFSDKDDSSVDASDVVVNIAWNGDNAKFYTTVTSLPVNGEVTSAGLLIAKFSKTIKSGKKTNTYFFAFKGHKALK